MNHRSALLGCALLLLACGSQRPITRNNFAPQYSVGGEDLHLDARLHLATPDHGTIYFRLRTRELLYKSGAGGPPYEAAVRVSYQAFSDPGLRQLIDSSSTFVGDRTDDPQADQELLGSMEMRRVESQRFWLRVSAYDLVRDALSDLVIEVDQGAAGTRLAFLPQSAATGRPYFDDHLMPGTTVLVRCDRFARQRLYCDRYAAVTALPPPVFSLGSIAALDTDPDSTFTVVVDSTGTFTHTLVRPGRYHFRPDPSSSEGFTLFAFTDAYPEVATVGAMLPALRYITSMQEFDNMSHATDRRKAIERFWLDATGGRDRARDAIRAYYRRVESANRHFTGLVEGWRSDRGLVHIIFGTPNTVYRGPNNETWIYGEETNLMSLTFTFVRRNDPFSANDLVLERDPVFKAAWYRNVESWRNGRVLQN